MSFGEWLEKNGFRAFLYFLGFLAIWGSFFVVNPGDRGIVVTLGHVSKNFRGEGLGFKFPFISSINEVTVRQETKEISAECYSLDLQQIKAKVKVLYSIPEDQVVNIFRKYSGNDFDSLVAPRVQEALKEITATSSAADVVHNREQIKIRALELARKKIGDLLVVADIVIENLDLSDQLEKAIEAKMVKQQEQEQAVYVQNKAKTDAATALITATGEANAIRVRGQAIRENPSLISLQIAEKWDGHAPLVVGAGSGANILLPLEKK